MALTSLPFLFPGDIFRSAMPYSSYDPKGRLINDYKKNKISIVVMLAEREEAKRITGRDLVDEYQLQSFELINLPIRDFGVPDIATVRDTILQVLLYSKQGDNIVIHCHAGVGRTGMIIACLAKIGLGFSPDEAIRWVREYIPGAIEILKQEELVRRI